MKYRKLRIAWSVGWGVLCLALIALWVRSYWWRDAYHGPSRASNATYLFSMQGELQYQWTSNYMYGPWRLDSFPVEDWHTPMSEFGYWFAGPDHLWVTVPYWTLVLITTTLAAAPWLRWRFSLRTLLAAMTVAAIGLGWIVYAIRK